MPANLLAGVFLINTSTTVKGKTLCPPEMAVIK